MALAELVEVTKRLSDEEINVLVDLAKLIETKKTREDNKVVFDLLKGGLIYMADDFDETPACFKGYI